MERNKFLLIVAILFIAHTAWGQGKNLQDFSFVIIPDRTGGFRTDIYEQTIEKVNILQPDFSIGIGDYVEGYTEDENKINKEWNEFDNIISTLNMPMYKVPGNHDYTGTAQQKIWQQRFGKAYQHFIYKNCLFLLLNSNDGDGVNISQEQLNYFTKAINENKKVAWTFVLLHHPLWNYPDGKGFSTIETQLTDRNYTVFAGHTHIYNYQQKNGKDYITLATAGGSSRLRGKAFGEIDHLTYISFVNQKPQITQIALSGFLNKDFTNMDKIKNALKIDSLSKIPVTILQNEQGSGGLYFQLRNNTDLPLNYQIDFLYQPFLSLSQNNIYRTVQPGETYNIFVEAKKIQPVSDSMRFIYTLQSANVEITKKAAIAYERNTPLLFSDTPVVFIKDYKVSIPTYTNSLPVQYSLNNSSDFSSLDNSFTINEGGKLNLRLYHPETKAYSQSQPIDLQKLSFLNPSTIREKQLKKGLLYSYYEGAFSVLPDFSKLKSLKKGIALDLDVEKIMEKENNFAITYSGLVKIPKDGLYKILLTSDDGSRLNIKGTTVVDNDGSHSIRTRQGFSALKKGFYPIDILYFEDFDGQKLEINFIDVEDDKEVAVEYYHKP